MNQSYYYSYPDIRNSYQNQGNDRVGFLIPYALGLATGPLVIGAFGPGYGRRPNYNYYPNRPYYPYYGPYYRPF